MFKSILTASLFLSSLNAFAQMSSAEKQNIENRLEGTFPTLRSASERSLYKMHMGLTAGIANPNGDIESSPEYGLNVGFQPYVPLGFGAEVSTSEIDQTNVQRTNLLVRGTYNLGGDIPVLRSSYLGVLTGPMFENKDGDTEWSIGPTVGFDIPLQNKATDYLSVGLTAKYLYTTNVQDTFATGAALKYWY